jgi:hypothetical protein
VIDRLERAGYVRRVGDPGDRRRVKIEVTPAWYDRSGQIWGPVASDWHTTLLRRFTASELGWIIDFFRATNDISQRHVDRLGGK